MKTTLQKGGNEKIMYKALASGCIGHNVTLEISAPIAKKYGFEGIFLDIQQECQRPIEETKRILAENNLKPAGIGLPVEFRAGEEVFHRDMEKLEEYAKYAAACGVDRCSTWILPASDTLSYEDNFELHRSRLKEAAILLERYGISLGLEYVGPPTMRIGKKYEFIHNLDQMLELCKAIGTGNMGILVDLFHWDMAQQTLADFKKFPNESWIVCVHVMDAPAGIPREEQLDSVRALPGSTGVLKSDAFFQGLKEIGYTGPVMVEPFVPELGEMPFEEAVKVVKESLDKIWA